MNLDAEELARLLGLGEGRQSEFKRGLPRDEKTARSLCAFANTRGGMLFVGVLDNGSVYGVPRPRDVIDRLRAISSTGIEPPLAIEVSIVELNGGRVVCCSVPLSPARPHAVVHADDRRELVVRVGSSNRAASGATLRSLCEGPSPRRSLDALEKQVLEWVGERARRAGQPGGDATARGFAKARNIGAQRAQRTFVRLERDGFLVAHGFGAKRVYAPA